MNTDLWSVPNGTVEEVFDRPNIGWSIRPVFSMSTEAEIDTFLPGQFVDLTGEGQVFVFEDVRADRPNFDGDYNDFVFSVSGSEGSAASVEEYINGTFKKIKPKHSQNWRCDWRKRPHGRATKVKNETLLLF